MHTGIFVSNTSAHYQPVQALAYWRKLVLNILALLKRKDTYQVCYLTTFNSSDCKMTSNSSKTPPCLSKCKTYED